MENLVELLGTYGGDRTHAASAWVSTDREITPEKEARIGLLLTKLASDGHHTPFEKSALHFLLTVEDATHIQILKHRIGVSVNGESARYKELKDDKFYTPWDWNMAAMDLNFDLMKWTVELERHSSESAKLYHQCLEELTPVIGRKRAKESARFFLPKANQIKLDVMFNFRSFMHFIKLRNEEHAQLEISQLSGKMLNLVKETGQFDLSLAAFGY